MPDTTTYDPPLAGVEILDASTGPMTAVGRLFADLGAHVTAVRLCGITEEAVVGPFVDGVPVQTAIDRHGIATVDIELASESDRDRFTELLSGTDILIENSRPGSPAEAALSVRGIRAQHPELVVLSISDFGRDNDYRNWQATTPVLHALSSELSRSGIPGREPLVPPAELPYQVAAAQAAVMTLAVYLDRLRSGEGDLIDFSVLDGAMQTLDPPFGTAGSASAGVAVSAQRRDWNAERQRYPIIACKDGHVRMCILAKRQWRGMFEWMGSPEEFADPSYDKLGKRFHSPHLLDAIEAFCADKTRSELEAQGQAHGVPTAAVLTLPEALNADHFAERGFFHDVELAPGVVAPIPLGVTEIDGHRASALTAGDVAHSRPVAAPLLARRQRRGAGLPLEGIRVLDLGVIVVGADTARLFGDLGADVVKIEHSAHPDGLRVGKLTSMTQPFAAGHRNKRSIGLDLAGDEGRALAHRLVAVSDVVLSNYKPGVAESLGMDYATLRNINPEIVVVDSSAFGPTGPWAKRLGYGPLVRAAVGFTNLWVYPGETETFCDTVTVYPDHVAARIGTLSALALLLRRERTGAGGSASVSQAEVMLSHLAADIAAGALQRSGHARTDASDRGPWGLFPTAGTDSWIAITARDDADRRALGNVVGCAPPPDGDQCDLEGAVRSWVGRHSATEATAILQAAGVPAGAVLHADEVPAWGYYQQRRAFREELHPHGSAPFVMENVQIHCGHVADPPLGQAPLLGEQTAEIAHELLGLDADEIARLHQRGVLETSEVQAVPQP
ncbi:CoA transferase [Mycobacterium sp. SMC-4]|uniref:CaiB/BaiF CoA-transferase family protein n=1 Tax=Mycobacterium sp. SMC-4 TaxID=2857059 RepID=UPI0021B3288E|nr:CoA transferase [Mycobacterium sp. SMC-4]UXA16712.1 CoA transferase [Mycobacterium sp. SMC-4]